MQRLIIALILTMALLAGCAGKGPAPEPAPPEPDPVPAVTEDQQPVIEEPEAGTKLWAVDLSGKAEPELLLEHSTPLLLRSMSPDGRYVLLVEQLGLYKGDFTAIPYLWDRTAGTLTAGEQTFIRTGIWSGNGFYLDWTTHMDLAFAEERFEQLEESVGLKEDERAIIAASYSPDNRRFAALVGHPWFGEPIDLVQGVRGGTGVITTPNLLAGHAAQMGTYARLSLSPDGEWLVLEGKDGTVLAPAADPEQWQQVGGGDAIWAPDSRHIWLRGGGVYDLTGRRVLETEDAFNMVWQPDGRGGVLQVPAGRMRLLGLDGSTAELKVPVSAVPAGFLPDGRLLIWKSIWK